MKKLILALLALVIAAPANASTPKDFATGIADKVVAIIESGDSEKAKEDNLIKLFRQNVDTEWMARFTMGRFHRQATPAQKQKFSKLYADYVIYSYIPKFRMYAGERMNVTQVLDEGEGMFTVKSTLSTKKSSTGSVLVDYKLKKSGSAFKIIDIVGEGVSLITTQRSDFSTPLDTIGIDGFLERLEQRVENLKKAPAPKAEKGAK